MSPRRNKQRLWYLDFLEGLHERLSPRTYLEIGVERGFSLALSRCKTIGVDPAPTVDQPLHRSARVVEATSDEYFSGLDGSGERPFGRLPIDLAYIDGLHHFEQALRDFIGIEMRCAPTSVVAFDDVLPRDRDEAARTPRPVDWAGDVFRIPFALKSYRSDLRLILVDTDPTGTLLAVGLDPRNTVLSEAFEDITREYIEADPQPVPDSVFSRRGALPGDRVLTLDLWEELKAARKAASYRASRR
jgi:hypothetical protein